MMEHFALKILEPFECYHGQSADYTSSVDEGKFEFKLLISEKQFRDEVKRNKKSLLEGTGHEFLLSQPKADKMNEWWAKLAKPQRAMFMNFQSIKGPKRSSIIEQKINSNVYHDEKP